MSENLPAPSGSQILIYQSDSGETHLEVRLQNETVWLTQNLMAELYRTTKQNISLHIQNIYEEGELVPEATVKKYLTVRREGSRTRRGRQVPGLTTARLRSATRSTLIRYFYKYTPPRPLEEIEADLKKIEKEIEKEIASMFGGSDGMSKVLQRAEYSGRWSDGRDCTHAS